MSALLHLPLYLLMLQKLHYNFFFLFLSYPNSNFKTLLPQRAKGDETIFLKPVFSTGKIMYLIIHPWANGTTDWFKIRKGVHQGCMFSPWLFNLYTEYIMRNAGLEDSQAGIKIARRNINNFIYADNTTLTQKAKRN